MRPTTRRHKLRCLHRGEEEPSSEDRRSARGSTRIIQLLRRHGLLTVVLCTVWSSGTQGLFSNTHLALCVGAQPCPRDIGGVGVYPSPTLVMDGLDVATGRPVEGEPRCRMDLPSQEQIRAAVRERSS
jgi:hypothetical protein